MTCSSRDKGCDEVGPFCPSHTRSLIAQGDIPCRRGAQKVPGGATRPGEVGIEEDARGELEHIIEHIVCFREGTLTRLGPAKGRRVPAKYHHRPGGPRPVGPWLRPVEAHGRTITPRGQGWPPPPPPAPPPPPPPPPWASPPKAAQCRGSPPGAAGSGWWRMRRQSP